MARDIGTEAGTTARSRMQLRLVAF